MRKRAFIAGLVAALVAGVGYGADWINVHVQDHGDKTEVSLHLPLSLVLTALDAVHTEELSHGKVSLHIENADIDWPRLLAELDRAPEGEYVTVRDRKANVRMAKRAGTVEIDVKEDGEHGDTVRIRLQQPILAAFHVDEAGQLDVEALVDSLAKMQVGELVRVESADANVRIWTE